ncbi:MAG: DUF2804 domain-containing protein [Chloroflexi bacterium]|nr:DUF2804 domain-containing protein [Chloroflexota bacterium]
MQQEITALSPLLDAQGKLVQVGWARHPLLDCNLENVRFYPFRALQFLRIKRWDYYGVTTPEYFFSATLSHIGYLGLVFAYLLDFRTGELIEDTLMVPLGKGIYLARNSDQGDSYFDNGRIRAAFHLEEEKRLLQVDWPSFHKGQGIAADVTLYCPPQHESMVIVIPIGRRRFYYNRKVNCLPATGWAQLGQRRFDFEPNRALGNLDWGRGVWEYKSFWVWASASAFLPDGRTLGLNMGYGFGDTSAATENAFILNGRIHKLEQISFEYDAKNFMRPWKIHSPDGRLDLEFVPFKERVARSDLFLLYSEVHQMFGRYNGTLRSDDGEELHIHDVIGWAEEHHAKW